MRNPFAQDMGAEIAELTTREEFMTATVKITDPGKVVRGDWNPQLKAFEYTQDGAEVYNGRARVTFLRWGSNREAGASANAYTSTLVQVSLPKDAVGLVKRGMLLVVTECPTNPALASARQYRCTSDLQGSMSASRVLEFAVDSDAMERAEPEPEPGEEDQDSGEETD